MTQNEQILALHGDLERVVDRCRMEFDLPLAAVVGVLEVLKQEILRNTMDAEEEDDGDS